MEVEQEYNAFMDKYRSASEGNDDMLAIIVSYCLSHCKREYPMSNDFYGKLDTTTLNLLSFVNLPGEFSPYCITSIDTDMVIIQYRDICIYLSFEHPEFRLVVNKGF